VNLDSRIRLGSTRSQSRNCGGQCKCQFRSIRHFRRHLRRHRSSGSAVHNAGDSAVDANIQ